MDRPTSTLTDRLSLSLRAWPKKDAAAESLPFLVSRIIEQRDFRNVTESSLEEEIRKIEANEAQPKKEDAESSGDEIQDITSQAEAFKLARVELMKSIGQAQMESAYALDFVSLLLSKHAPKQAEVTISPFLKKNVPMGTLGVERIQLPQVIDTKRLDDKLVSTGWKLQSLGATVDSLLRSATRLTKEMDEESRYWEQVLAIKEKGWSICRLPREKHTLGVRYGFSEAVPEFRERGLAALRRAEGGNINLDLGSRAPSSRTLHIKVQQNGKVITSSIPRKDRQIESTSIEKLILHARDNIFDEELYHELHREARTLTNRRVRCVGDKITFPLATGKQVIMELTSVNETLPESEDSSSMNNDIAEFILNAARILLSHAHRQTLNRRSQLQPPLTEKRPARPLYSILRPILAHLEHLSASETLHGFLKDIELLLEGASVPLIINHSSSTTELVQIANPTRRRHQTFVDAFVLAISAPLHSTVALEFPSTSSHIAIHTRTFLMGTEYKVVVVASAPNSYLSSIPKETHFTSAQGMEEYLTHLLTLDVISLIEASPDNGGWTATSPHTGQLAINRNVDRSPQSMVLSINQDGMSLRWNDGSYRQETEGAYFWHMTNKNDGPRKDLLEITRRVASGLTI